MRWRDALPTLAVLFGSLSGAVGCPVLLKDDFDKAPATRSSESPGVDSGGSAGEGDGAVVHEDGPVVASPCTTCAARETCCDGVCVDLLDDPRNCRSCGTGCPGTVCSNATCTNICALGFIDCNRNVIDGCEVNAATDPSHCGNCGIECAFGERCIEGVCVCPENTTDCDGQSTNACETDTGSDPSNCGGCGRVCGANETCSGGLCACKTGFADCNAEVEDGCEASLDSNGTCGACNSDCGPLGTCILGACNCAAGFLDCDAAIPGCETPVNDPAHCGSCTTACGIGTPVCDGTACLSDCGALTRCDSSCVDTSTDVRNCGTCGNALGPHQSCVEGRAQCEIGYADCDSVPSDCEADTRVDTKNCGACHGACKPGAICSGGTCTCGASTPRDCGTACQECCSNADCSDGDSCTTDTCTSGACQFSASCAAGGVCCAGTGCFECCGNADCPSGAVCSNNACVALVCNAPLVACGAICADLSSDAQNCNGCGRSCGVGRACVGSVCTPSWLATSSAPAGLGAREKMAYAAFGSKVFIWGGADSAGKELATGAVYDVSTDTWSDLPVGANTPSARVLSTAVWTGTYMVVWGGGDAAGTVDHASGARFNPATGLWTALSGAGAPGARRAPYGFWTGSRVLFWGGFDRAGKPVIGAYSYDPGTDVWTTAKAKDQPPALLHPTVGWSGTLLLIYGGQPDGSSSTQHTYSYSPGSDSWRHLHDGMGARYGALGTWDGSTLLAWSGSVLKNEGKRYHPASDSWVSMATTNAPAVRFARHRATGWSTPVSAGVTLILGGEGESILQPTALTDGAIYNATTNTWTAVAPWPSRKSHVWGVGVLAGSEFVLWGGRADSTSALTNVGERIHP